MEVIRQSREFDKVEKYLLTQDGCVSVKDVADGAEIVVTGIMTYEKEDSKGESSELTSFMDKAGEVYTTKSATFSRKLWEVADIMLDENTTEFTIVKQSGTTKAGRDFVTCRLKTK